MNRFAGQVALVTGAARGIGLAIAARLVAEGATVYFADVDGDEAERAASGLTDGDSERRIPVQLDITDEKACRELAGEIGKRNSRLDVLVNNAAILDISPIEDLTVERFREVTRVNLDGALICTLAALPLMEKTGGRILIVGGSSGYQYELNIAQVFARQIAIIGSTMGPHRDYVAFMEQVFAGRIKAVIGARLPLSEARRAQGILERNEVFGKVVLEL